MNYKEKDGLYAVVETEKGNIVLNLEYKKTPMTVTNFVGLIEGELNIDDPGNNFYEGLSFHRVINDFMIQGGCPKGDGTGGPGYSFPDEFDDSLKLDGPGVLAMANAGPNTNGSQFFITHVETPWLNGKHTVFGKVVEGQDIVNSIKTGDRIKNITIDKIGASAKNFKVTKQAFHDLVEKAVEKAEGKEKEEEKKLSKEIDNRWPGNTLTSTGLRYIITKKGDGKGSPAFGKDVTVHYQGSLMNGKIFDSSIMRKEPATFKIGQVIEGWNQALVTMTKGEKRTLIIPPELGYGVQGFPGVIPPKAYLIFDVELLDF